jgi:hypothetical protein
MDKVETLFEIDNRKTKSKIVKLFNEFYKQYSSFNDSIPIDFEITKNDLKDI